MRHLLIPAQHFCSLGLWNYLLTDSILPLVKGFSEGISLPQYGSAHSYVAEELSAMLAAISRPLLLPHNTNSAWGGSQGSSCSCLPGKPHSLCLDILTQPGRGGRAAPSHSLSPGSSWGCQGHPSCPSVTPGLPPHTQHWGQGAAPRAERGHQSTGAVTKPSPVPIPNLSPAPGELGQGLAHTPIATFGCFSYLKCLKQPRGGTAAPQGGLGWDTKGIFR